MSMHEQLEGQLGCVWPGVAHGTQDMVMRGGGRRTPRLCPPLATRAPARGVCWLGVAAVVAVVAAARGHSLTLTPPALVMPKWCGPCRTHPCRAPALAVVVDAAVTALAEVSLLRHADASRGETSVWFVTALVCSVRYTKRTSIVHLVATPPPVGTQIQSQPQRPGGRQRRRRKVARATRLQLRHEVDARVAPRAARRRVAAHAAAATDVPAPSDGTRVRERMRVVERLQRRRL